MTANFDRIRATVAVCRCLEPGRDGDRNVRPAAFNVVTTGLNPSTGAFGGVDRGRSSPRHRRRRSAHAAAGANVTTNGNLALRGRSTFSCRQFDGDLRSARCNRPRRPTALHTDNVVYNGSPSLRFRVADFACADNDRQAQWIVTFAGNTDDGVDGAPFADGVYDLRIDAAKVHPEESSTSTWPGTSRPRFTASSRHRPCQRASGGMAGPIFGDRQRRRQSALPQRSTTRSITTPLSTLTATASSIPR